MKRSKENAFRSHLPGFAGALFCSIGALCALCSPCELPTAMAMRNLVAPLYITNAQFASLLTITNMGDAPVDVVASFNSLEGKRVSRKEILVHAHSSTTAYLDSIDMLEHRFAALGSIVISIPAPNADAIRGSLSIVSRKEGHKINVKEELQPAEATGAVKVASLPALSSVPVIAVTNFGELTRVVSLSCSDGGGRKYESRTLLPAHMTFLLNACIAERNEARGYEQILRGDAGPAKAAMSLAVKTDGPEGRIFVWGLVRSTRGEPPGEIRSVEFFDHGITDR